MKKLLVTIATAGIALSVAGVAHAGCFATAGLSPLVRPGHAAGTPWVVTIRVMQHGVTPLVGAKPAVRIHKLHGKPRVFEARPTKRAGTYRARVVFPTAGRYTLRVYDGFPVRPCARMHTFRPVVIAAAV